jgi:hypothetical protein
MHKFLSCHGFLVDATPAAIAADEADRECLHQRDLRERIAAQADFLKVRRRHKQQRTAQAMSNYARRLNISAMARNRAEETDFRVHIEMMKRAVQEGRPVNPLCYAAGRIGRIW